MTVPVLVALMLLFVGLAFLFYERITEITISKIGTIKTAVEQAQADAGAISALRKGIEEQAQATNELRASVQAGAEQVAKTLQYLQTLQKQLDELRQKMADLDKRSLPSPPPAAGLEFGSSKFAPTNSGIAGQVLFRPTGVLALTTVEFSVQVQGSGDEHILKIEPSVPVSLNVMISVSPDGRQARISYAVVGNHNPGFRIELSGPAALRIDGSPGITPFDLDARV